VYALQQLLVHLRISNSIAVANHDFFISQGG
jgi:hypothetical protein